MASDVPGRPARLPERWFEVTSTALGLTAAAALAWVASQVVGMRDDIHTLKDDLPPMSQRLDHVEARVDKLDDELQARR